MTIDRAEFDRRILTQPVKANGKAFVPRRVFHPSQITCATSMVVRRNIAPVLAAYFDPDTRTTLLLEV